MAQTTTISTKELKRQAGLCFEGKTVKVMLCYISSTSYTAESTVADWQSIEVSGNGYTRFSTVMQTGTYSTVSNSYEIPSINAQFTATNSYSYNVVVIYIDGELYPHSIIVEDPNIVIAAGQVQTYVIGIRQDD